MTGDNLEQRIRDLLAEGLEKTEIARRLGISRKTLYKHLKRMQQSGALPESAETDTTAKDVTHRRRGAPLGNRNAAGNRGGPGGKAGNKNALVTGEYETLWDDGLSPRERVAMHEAGRLATLDQVHRQLGLLDIRIGRLLERIRQTREALAVGVELQLESRSDTDGTVAGQDMNVTTTRMVHTREILDRQEKALDRMLQRRERLLALKIKLEELSRRWPDDGPDDPLEALVRTLAESRRRQSAESSGESA